VNGHTPFYGTHCNSSCLEGPSKTMKIGNQDIWTRINSEVFRTKNGSPNHDTAVPLPGSRFVGSISERLCSVDTRVLLGRLVETTLQVT
jgi:hypothetical protein